MTSAAVLTLPRLVDAPRCAAWLVEAQAALARAGSTQAGPGQDPSVWPCSLPLADLPDLFDSVCTTLQARPALRDVLQARLGERRWLIADHCFVRHQPAPGLRGPGQSPHSWHQDGALAFDFAAPSPYPAEALLPIQTCWLPLTDCGDDAPSLAWFEPPPARLWSPQELGDPASVTEDASPGPPATLHSAVLAAGDALLFGGGTVHRTHATAAMRRRRISVELRWLPDAAVPARLARGRLLEVR